MALRGPAVRVRLAPSLETFSSKGFHVSFITRLPEWRGDVLIPKWQRVVLILVASSSKRS